MDTSKATGTRNGNGEWKRGLGTANGNRESNLKQYRQAVPKIRGLYLVNGSKTQHVLMPTVPHNREL